MAEAHLDHLGEISWFAGYGPSPVLGPCPHVRCPHTFISNIAWGPDWQHYTLDRCDVPGGCNGECRAWHTDRSVATTPWLQIEAERLLTPGPEGTTVVEQDRACPHDDFSAFVDVNRLTATDDGPVTGYAADIRIQCADCAEPFRWVGVPAGLDPRRPMCSPDETELHAPIRPASADPDFGLGLPGFAIRYRDGGE